MYERINYLIVGIFVLLFTALAFYAALWIAKEDKRESNYNHYIIYFSESVDGLNKDSAVKINGVNVGRVKELKIDPNELSRVRVDISIAKSIKITKDMYAMLQGQGLTGLRYINILGGKSKEYIEPNSENSIIPAKKSVISKLSDSAANLTQKVNRLLSEENLNNLTKILENGKQLTKKAIVLEGKLQSLIGESNRSQSYSISDLLVSLQDINKTLTAYRELAESGKSTLSSIDKRIPKLFKSIESSAKSLEHTSHIISTTIKRGDYNLKRILTPAVKELRVLSSDYRELGDELKAVIQDPSGALLNGKSIQKGPGE